MRGERRIVTDGPFAETKEQLGGYYLIEAADLDAAIDGAAGSPRARIGTVEVRPIQELVERRHARGRRPRRGRAAFREDSGRVLATLIRVLGDFDLAEEASQDAYVAALERWPVDGRTPQPRRLDHDDGPQPRDRPAPARTRTAERPALASPSAADRAANAIGDEDDDVDDPGRPAATDLHLLPPGARRRTRQVALTLRTLGGLTTPEIARAFLVPEPTLAQRLVRAKKDPRGRHPYGVPAAERLPSGSTRCCAVAVPRVQRGLRGDRRER